MTTNVHAIAAEMGQCAICDGLNRKLAFRDQTTGQRCCMACVEFLRTADRCLTMTSPATGIVHPTPSTQF